MTHYSTLDSPIGPLLLVGDGASLTGLYMELHTRGPVVQSGWRRDDAALAEPRTQLAAYFSGELERFELELRPRGTEFQRRVWDALRAIPFGQTTTYGALAREIGCPNACRAVGRANGRNPVSIVVPCHRVVGAGGSLTGYGGGIERKRWLLEHERAAAQMPLAAAS